MANQRHPRVRLSHIRVVPAKVAISAFTRVFDRPCSRRKSRGPGVSVPAFARTTLGGGIRIAPEHTMVTSRKIDRSGGATPDGKIGANERFSCRSQSIDGRPAPRFCVSQVIVDGRFTPDGRSQARFCRTPVPIRGFELLRARRGFATRSTMATNATGVGDRRQTMPAHAERAARAAGPDRNRRRPGDRRCARNIARDGPNAPPPPLPEDGRQAADRSRQAGGRRRQRICRIV
jgi:hypothetical protein